MGSLLSLCFVLMFCLYTISASAAIPPFLDGGREAYRFRRRSLSDVFEKANGTGPRSPPPPPYGM